MSEKIHCDLCDKVIDHSVPVNRRLPLESEAKPGLVIPLIVEVVSKQDICEECFYGLLPKAKLHEGRSS